jgi:hypothetical protein
MPTDDAFLRELAIAVRPGGDGGPDSTTIVATAGDGTLVGWLDLFPLNEYGRPVCTVEVIAQARRRGVATMLWRYAQGVGLQPIHDSEQTDDGHAWALTVPEEHVPQADAPRVRVHQHRQSPPPPTR